MERNTSPEKKTYNPPKLTVHGDVEAITLGTEVGESLDGAFRTAMDNPRGTKQPKEPVYS